VSARAVYLATRKIPDGIWNRFVCRPLAAVLVDWVKDTRVTPNQITLLSALVAAFAAYLLAGLPGHRGLVVAIVVYEASYVLDCADGMLARLRGIQSARGHLLDFLMDELKAFVILAAASFRLFREYGDDRFLVVGLFGLAALASGTSLTTFMRRPEVVLPTGPAGAPSLVRRAVGLAEACGKFVVHYPSYIWLAALVGKLEYYLFPYVVANALYAVRAFASVARRFARE
jgi:phosphatidylglycerophosphate synthase